MAKVIFVRYPDHKLDGSLTAIGVGQLAELADCICDYVNVGYLEDVCIVYETQVHSLLARQVLSNEMQKHGAKCDGSMSSHRSVALQTLEVRVGFIHAVAQRHMLTLVLADAEGCKKLPAMFAALYDFNKVEERHIGTGQAVVVDAENHASWVIC